MIVRYFISMFVGLFAISAMTQTVDIDFSNVSIFDDSVNLDGNGNPSSGNVIYKFTGVGTDSLGTNLNAFMTITGTENNPNFSSGNGLLVNGGSGTGGSSDVGVSTIDGNNDLVDDTIFFAIGQDSDAFARFNIRFTDADNSDAAYTVTDNVLFQAFDIDQDTTNNDFSDTFGFLSSQTSAGPFFGDNTQLVATTQVIDGVTFDITRLGGPQVGGPQDGNTFFKVGNINTDPSAPEQVEHTVAVLYDTIGTTGIDFAWGMTGQSGSRRGLFLSATNPPLVPPVIPEVSSILMVGLSGLAGLVSVRIRKRS